ncbi:hypothetical protein TNCV_3507341 [Trichonephila clavipes]|uniref:Uncharacterized protein n=1 Tax=Trichonephila clavipes TaxID=2585209 RepID=A0A8X6V848_TRICX|nr:hypothetical protein TNCV_3507341 [Trichonephila clavipes]
MNFRKCIVPSWHGGTLNNRRATNPLVKLVEGKERWEAPDHPQAWLERIAILAPMKPKRRFSGKCDEPTTTCMVLKATANRKVSLSPLP